MIGASNSLEAIVGRFADELDAVLCRHEGRWLNGQKIFELHDTFGLPFAIIRDGCRERDCFFDETGIRAELRCCYGWNAARIEEELR